MTPPPSHPATRRAFVQGLARYTALSAVLGITGIAVLRRANSASACPRASLCQGCPVAPTCSLPQKQANLPPSQSDS